MLQHPDLPELLTRSLFGSDKSSNFTCARPKPNEHGAKLSIGITAKSLMEYMAYACLGLTTASALFLIWKHLHRYTCPKEQRQNVRIIFMPVIFCALELLSIIFYSDSIYLSPLKETYQAFCIAALFLLYVEFVCPDEQMRDAYFNGVENKDRKGNVIPGGSLLWFNRTWIVVFQYPFTKTISCIIEIATQAANKYCMNSLSPKYAHIWLLLADTFLIGGAISAVFRFYGRFKKEFDPKHHALAKLVCFKGVVFFQFFQMIIFGFLAGKTFRPSKTLTYDDIYYGIPSTLTCLEATAFSFTFHFAYRSRVYHSDMRPDAYRMPTWRAILDAMNLSDIIRGSMYAITLLIQKRSPTGHGFGQGPKRQRTSELDDMAREPLKTEQYRSTSPIPGAYVPTAPGTQQYGVTHAYGDVAEQQLLGYDDYRTGGAEGRLSRDPSPSRPAQAPRDMV
ncbi:uncharacterized protein BDZ99DRAFT_461417 [Mytilinidion resinicola]|uniref:DUF300-domain-containing protein n=1 Tax=Mytilinidion resinicola TaxID=574789 RepID=A0A6A6YTH0_9PEZI|nr:uncharacterized protein BDZ99DRAFT_461417 [Mytilinidion resinicola]KAF2811324.1 hypothetical protein BDZ99DRAFT_461417 [Mytilinidion resinicola]